MIFFPPGSKRNPSTEVAGEWIKVKDAIKYVDRHKIRTELLHESTNGKTGVGRIDKANETLGWYFDKQLLVDFLASMQEDQKVVILFGVDLSNSKPRTHVVIAYGDEDPVRKKLITPLPPFQQDPEAELFLEQGGTCCQGRIHSITELDSLSKCFESLTGTRSDLVSEVADEATSQDGTADS